ncbi:tyrosine-type recombinase/integrase [Sulfurospirillum cavolei]|uniref:tyrosine-type recombinase/integrase n=1 Tax=Sulfurospirillum cavolei TaxID=366522 RepID=UPI003FA3036F
MAKSIKYVYGELKFTIKEQFGHWYLDFYLPSGERQRGTTKLKATTENLKVIKRQVIPDIYEGLGKEPIGIEEEAKTWTLQDFAEEFFELQKTQIRPHTLERNIMHYNNHIAPYFGKKELGNITPLEIERWQNQLLQKYKHLTVQKFRSILFSIYDKALHNDIVLKNPLEKVTAPKVQNNFKIEEINPFTEKELNQIIEHANGYMKNFIKLMAATGMRPGEIIALKWSDIDFEKRTIKVERTRLRSKKGEDIVDGLTKTMSSNRFVDMLNATYDALMAQSKLTNESEYIFLNQSNMPFYNHDIIGVNFRKILKQSGVKARPLYNLRHTFASQMISKGADITWVSKMLGHKDVSITLKIYTKFIQEDDETRLRKIAQMDKFMVKFDNSDDKNTDK